MRLASLNFKREQNVCTKSERKYMFVEYFTFLDKNVAQMYGSIYRRRYTYYSLKYSCVSLNHLFLLPFHGRNALRTMDVIN